MVIDYQQQYYSCTGTQLTGSNIAIRTDDYYNPFRIVGIISSFIYLTLLDMTTYTAVILTILVIATYYNNKRIDKSVAQQKEQVKERREKVLSKLDAILSNLPK